MAGKVSSAKMTYEDLESELEIMFPGTSRKVAADKLAEIMPQFTARNIQAYLYGHRNIVKNFEDNFIQVLEVRSPDRAVIVRSRLANRAADEPAVTMNNRSIKLQAAIDQMCLSCAGDKVEDGGFCWDKGCPLALFTKYPHREEVPDDPSF